MLPQEKLVVVVDAAEEDGVLCCQGPFEKGAKGHGWMEGMACQWASGVWMREDKIESPS